VEDAALHWSRFGTGWIASGGLPGPGDPATSAEMNTSAGVRTSAGVAPGVEEATSKEAAVNEGKPAHIATMDMPIEPPDRLDEQFAVVGAVFVQEPEEPGEQGKLEEPAELEEQEEPGEPKKPEKPAELGEPEESGEPKKLGELEELGVYWKLEEDSNWDERPPGEDKRPLPFCMDWSCGCGAEDTVYILGRARPPAVTRACIKMPTE
jgi:hypothetical protein